MRQDDAAPLDLVDVGVTEQTQSVLGLVLQNVGRSSHAASPPTASPYRLTKAHWSMVTNAVASWRSSVSGAGAGAGVGAGRVSRWAISAIRVLIR